MLISIIVPIYNAEEYLVRCIESILKQTFVDYELILIDDGSSDHSSVICDDFSQKDERIKVIHQKNSGVSVARNVGIENAKGKYIMFVDADDYIAPTLCENLLNEINKDVDLVISGYTKVLAKCQEKISTDTIVLMGVEELRNNFDFYFQIPLLNSPCAKLYKIEQLRDLRFEPAISMGEDLIFNLKYYTLCKQIIFLPISDYFYNCINENSAMHRFKEEYFSCRKRCYLETKKFKYGKIGLTNDLLDKAFCKDSIGLIQQICYLDEKTTYECSKIQEICNDEMVQLVCTGKYRFSKNDEYFTAFVQAKKIQTSTDLF